MRSTSAHGNGNNEFAAVPFFRTDQDAAIMKLDDTLAHGQSDAVTGHGRGGMFPSKKGGKDQRLFFYRNACTVVSKANIDGVFAGPNTNPDGAVC